MSTLTDRQQRFVDAYAGNAADAARAAGYSKATADRQGHRLLKHPAVAAAIQRREAERSSETIANREARQRFWTKVMLDAGQEMPARLRASELLAKSEGDFIERHELEAGPGFADLVAASMKPRQADEPVPAAKR